MKRLNKCDSSVFLSICSRKELKEKSWVFLRESLNCIRPNSRHSNCWLTAKSIPHAWNCSININSQFNRLTDLISTLLRLLKYAGECVLHVFYDVITTKLRYCTIGPISLWWMWIFSFFISSSRTAHWKESFFSLLLIHFVKGENCNFIGLYARRLFSSPFSVCLEKSHRRRSWFIMLLCF